jgi:hypothetical protein
MTTPDIAGLCERLRETRSVWSQTKEVSVKRRRNPDGPEAADTLERQAAEIERLRGALKEARIVVFDATMEDLYPSLAVEIFAQIDAALTGEDTAGSPTGQNTEPGLAFFHAGEL